MSDAAVSFGDVGCQNLRALPTACSRPREWSTWTKGWTLSGLAEGWQQYQVAADGAYGEEINLPAPLNFGLTTAAWPRRK